MKVTLANGKEVFPIIVVGEKRQLHNARRDALSFVFPVETSLDELDEAFTDLNCEKITITDENEDAYIHHGYSVRAELCRRPVVVTQATDTTEEVIEQRAVVVMAQRTYTETQFAEMKEALELILSGDTGEEA